MLYYCEVLRLFLFLFLSRLDSGVVFLGELITDFSEFVEGLVFVDCDCGDVSSWFVFGLSCSSSVYSSISISFSLSPSVAVSPESWSFSVFLFL